MSKVVTSVRIEEFEKCLLGWMTALHEMTDGQVIAIDGKTLRGTDCRPVVGLFLRGTMQNRRSEQVSDLFRPLVRYSPEEGNKASPRMRRPGEK